MLYQEIIEDIIISRSTPPVLGNGLLDLDQVARHLRERCPGGSFYLEWKDPRKTMGLFDEIDVDLISIVFHDDHDRVEWMLRYS